MCFAHGARGMPTRGELDTPGDADHYAADQDARSRGCTSQAPRTPRESIRVCGRSSQSVFDWKAGWSAESRLPKMKACSSTRAATRRNCTIEGKGIRATHPMAGGLLMRTGRAGIGRAVDCRVEPRCSSRPVGGYDDHAWPQGTSQG